MENTNTKTALLVFLALIVSMVVSPAFASGDIPLNDEDPISSTANAVLFVTDENLDDDGSIINTNLLGYEQFFSDIASVLKSDALKKGYVHITNSSTSTQVSGSVTVNNVVEIKIDVSKWKAASSEELESVLIRMIRM